MNFIVEELEATAQMCWLSTDTHAIFAATCCLTVAKRAESALYGSIRNISPPPQFNAHPTRQYSR